MLLYIFLRNSLQKWRMWAPHFILTVEGTDIGKIIDRAVVPPVACNTCQSQMGIKTQGLSQKFSSRDAVERVYASRSGYSSNCYD